MPGQLGWNSENFPIICYGCDTHTHRARTESGATIAIVHRCVHRIVRLGLFEFGTVSDSNSGFRFGFPFG